MQAKLKEYSNDPQYQGVSHKEKMQDIGAEWKVGYAALLRRLTRACGRERRANLPSSLQTSDENPKYAPANKKKGQDSDQEEEEEQSE